MSSHEQHGQARHERSGVAIPDGLAAMTTGTDLAVELGGIEVTGVAGRNTVEVMIAAYRQATHQRALFLQALLETGMRNTGSTDTVVRCETPGEFASEEARAALLWTRRRADSTFAFAWDVFERLPILGEAMLAGDLDEPRAQVFVSWTTGLTTDQAATICANLLPRAASLTTGELAAAVKRAAIEVDPEWAERRYRKAINERRVVGSHNPDGSANVSGLNLPVDRAVAARSRVAGIAKTAKAAGDNRPIDHIRAEVYLGLLDGTFRDMADHDIAAWIIAHPFADTTGNGGGSDGGDSESGPNGNGPGGGGGPSVGGGPNGGGPSGGGGCAESECGPHVTPTRRAASELRLGLVTAVGHDQRAGEIPGWGVIPAAVARSMVHTMHTAEWRYAVCDPCGRLVHAGTTRRRPRRLETTGVQTTGGVVELQVTVDELKKLAGDGGAHEWAAVVADIHGAHTEAAANHGQPNSGGAPGCDPSRRRATANLRRFVQIRDRQCVFPGCRMPATDTDQDHRHDYAHGGRTIGDNLESLCRYHHRLKHDGGWEVTDGPSEFITWHSPLGRGYTVRPPPVMIFTPQWYRTVQRGDPAATLENDPAPFVSEIG